MRNRLPGFTSPAALVAVVTLLVACAHDAGAKPDDPPAGTPVSEKPAEGQYRISGPFTHANLTIFLIHGAAGSTAEMLTLQEAMETGVLVVHETSNVNELEVENRGDKEVFIQASEIVKGGKQDRAMAVDMIVPAKSGRVAIAAFCVERGRWQKRGDEDAGVFSGSHAVLNSKELKMAAKYSANQSEVWSAVSRSQAKLARSAGAQVTDTMSSSSLQLTLENENVAKLSEEYVEKLTAIIEGSDDVIGYAFAVNGAINSADVYASTSLFRKLWPKMLRAAAIEAVAERNDTAAARPAGSADVSAVLSDAERGRGTRKTDAGRARAYSFESEKNVLFETRDADEGGWVHRNYVTK